MGQTDMASPVCVHFMHTVQRTCNNLCRDSRGVADRTASTDYGSHTIQIKGNVLNACTYVIQINCSSCMNRNGKIFTVKTYTSHKESAGHKLQL
jgi:hypothetical protein